jgi:hypothetical protein
MSNHALIPVFMPPLANVLAHAEKQKGSPLTLAEVEKLRDESPCIMMQAADAGRMDETRGFVDVNPRNVWADWHRLRSQMVGGYLPRIVLCIPGGDDLQARCEAILKSANVEHEFRPHDAKMVKAFRSSSIAWPAFTSEDLAHIEAHAMVLYVVSGPVISGEARAVGLSFLNLGKRLLEASGGIGIKSDSSGISHSRSRWVQFAESAARDPAHGWSALFHAYVVYPIGSETDLYSCGMHLLGAPDLIVDQATIEAAAKADKTPAAAAAELFRVFGMYLLMECRTGQFASGHTFSIERDAPRYRVIWEACAGYPEDSYFFNPFGRWRFTAM